MSTYREYRHGPDEQAHKFPLLSLLKLSVILFALSGCRNSPDIPLTPVLTFDQDVSSIIVNNCATAGCHDGSGERRRLVTYKDVMHYVTPEKPYQSELFTTITRLSGNKMPPAGLMSDDQIKIVYIWILQGAQEK